MRLEVLCEDRIGLTRELLDILTAQNIDLRGIEIDPVGIIYLNFPELEFESFRDIMAQIRRIDGVEDVRRIPFMPVERKNTELTALFNNLSEPLLSVGSNGKVDMANQSAHKLFASETLIETSISSLLPKFDYEQWREHSRQREKQKVVIRGIDYQLEASRFILMLRLRSQFLLPWLFNCVRQMVTLMPMSSSPTIIHLVLSTLLGCLIVIKH